MKLLKSTFMVLFATASLSIAGEGHCPTGLGPWGYIFGYGGVSFGPDVDGRGNDGTIRNYDFEDDFIVGGGLGMYSDFLCGSRFEIEGLYSSNEMEAVNGVQLPAGSDGELEIAAIMVNLLKEFPLWQKVTGYAGGGLGYAGVEFNFNNAGVREASSDSMFAWQVIAGADYCLTPCISLFTQYKLLGISDLNYNSGGVFFENEAYLSHNVMAGLRYSF